MKSLTKNQKLLLTVGIGLCIIILYIAVIIYPQTSNILKFNEDIHQEKIQLAQLDIEGADLKKFKDKEAEVNYILNQLSVHLIKEEDILDFIVQLEDIAEKTNNEQEINIQQEEEKPAVKKTEGNTEETESSQDGIKVQVTLKGDFNSLMDYLTELENAEILSDQLSLNTQLQGLDETKTNTPLTEEEEIPSDNQLSTVIELNVYLAK